MTRGTKSVLFGAHCFVLHPFFVAWAWWRLYGFPWDPRLWLCFAVHDIGYIGKRFMDDEVGEKHPEVGARIAGKLFGWRWYDFCLLHSRYYAKKLGRPPSRLCIADKYAICLTPWWLYIPMTMATSELREYMSMIRDHQEAEKFAGMRWQRGSRKSWYLSLQRYMDCWVKEHREGQVDRWTGAA